MHIKAPIFYYLNAIVCQFSKDALLQKKILLIKAPEIFGSFINIKFCFFFRRFDEEVKIADSKWNHFNSRCWKKIILNKKCIKKGIVYFAHKHWFVMPFTEMLE